MALRLGEPVGQEEFALGLVVTIERGDFLKAFLDLNLAGAASSSVG